MALTRQIGLVQVVFVLLAVNSRADLTVNDTGLYGGGRTPIDPNSTIVEVQYTGNGGVWAYGDAQTASNCLFAVGSCATHVANSMGF
jgi:hypothetical protein